MCFYTTLGIAAFYDASMYCKYTINLFLLQQATGDFSIEPLPTSNPHSKLFTIEPLKSNVEAGATKTVTITFHVPRDCSPKTYEADTNVSQLHQQCEPNEDR